MLKSQNRSEFRYLPLPEEHEFAEVRRLSISMVHLPSYIQLLRQFLPTGATPEPIDLLEKEKLEGEMFCEAAGRHNWQAAAGTLNVPGPTL